MQKCAGASGDEGVRAVAPTPRQQRGLGGRRGSKLHAWQALARPAAREGGDELGRMAGFGANASQRGVAGIGARRAQGGAKGAEPAGEGGKQCKVVGGCGAAGYYVGGYAGVSVSAGGKGSGEGGCCTLQGHGDPHAVRAVPGGWLGVQTRRPTLGKSGKRRENAVQAGRMARVDQQLYVRQGRPAPAARKAGARRCKTGARRTTALQIRTQMGRRQPGGGSGARGVTSTTCGIWGPNTRRAGDRQATPSERRTYG